MSNNISNRQLNGSLAGQIALNLDKSDGKADGQISGSVWNDFWENNNLADSKGKKENVSNEGISIQDAFKLIMTRIFNAAKKQLTNTEGKSWDNQGDKDAAINDIAKNLFKNAGGEKLKAENIKTDTKENAVDRNTTVDTAVKAENSQVTTEPKRAEVKEVACHRTEEEQQEYKKILNKAKEIVLENAELLKLSDRAIELIKNITTESITYGPSRWDLEEKVIKFNINDTRTPDVNNFIVLILHEAEHGVIDNYTRENAYEQERTVQTKALNGVQTLLKAGKIEDSEVWGKKGSHVKISELNSEEKTNKFVDDWLVERYSFLQNT